MSITKTAFGQFEREGALCTVYAYVLENASGMRVKILNYGGTIVELWVPDREGRLSDVIGGYDDLNSYLHADGYQGALIGRFGNRIAKGCFSLEGKEYRLATNNGVNHLHGGIDGFDKKLWEVTEKDGDEPELILHTTSPDGEEGYPGTLDITVTYRLTRQNGLVIRYVATTDATTILNLTNHSYFNLRGFSAGSVRPLYLTLDADAYLPTDNTLIPTGEIRSVAGTPFDFRVAKQIGQDIDAEDEALRLAKGYDHCLRFTPRTASGVCERGSLYDPDSGRLMTLYTDQPCVQLYTGNCLGNEKFPMKGGYPQAKQTFVCLETEGMPDSIHHPNFTNCVLQPGERYDFTTEYRFSVRKD